LPTFGQQAFTSELLAAFPELADDIAGSGGVLHVVMGSFASFTQAAKSRGDWPSYERCILLADRCFEGADAALSGAFSAFFEHLDFEGTRGPAAWQLLTPRLQAAWKRMDAENRRLMALPQNRRKDTRETRDTRDGKDTKGRKDRTDRKRRGRRRR
jgi:hypothetical protein